MIKTLCTCGGAGGRRCWTRGVPSPSLCTRTFSQKHCSLWLGGGCGSPRHQQTEPKSPVPGPAPCPPTPTPASSLPHSRPSLFAVIPGPRQRGAQTTACQQVPGRSRGRCLLLGRTGGLCVFVSRELHHRAASGRCSSDACGFQPFPSSSASAPLPGPIWPRQDVQGWQWPGCWSRPSPFYGPSLCPSCPPSQS